MSCSIVHMYILCFQLELLHDFLQITKSHAKEEIAMRAAGGCH